MPRAIPVPVRHTLLRRSRDGHAAADIAADLGLSVRTVRHLARRFQLGGETAVTASYRPGLRATSDIHSAAVGVRRDHPTWGAPFIRLHLTRLFPGRPIPAVRNLQRLFARHGLPGASAGRRPTGRRTRADCPHAVWQMDAAEQLPLADARRVSWLRLVDEASGAFLQTTVVPVGAWPQVSPESVRGSLRQAFARWGLPGLLRVDNGLPWGSHGDLPTDLALWLIGLGVKMWWNPPRRPQDNGVVERSQGTGKRWAEPHTCQNPEELQARLDDHDTLQRSVYPYKDGTSRVGWWPGLAHSGRAYTATQEADLWSWNRVAEHLRDQCVGRRVDQKGQVSVYNRNLYVGKVNRQKEVRVMFATDPARWVVADTNGVILKEVDAPELSAPRIQALDVTHRRRPGEPSEGEQARHQPAAKPPVAIPGKT